MRIKKNGKVVNLTESDLKRIVKRTLNEQGVPEPNKSFIQLIGAIEHFHPELRTIEPDVGEAVHHIFDKGRGFSMKNMKDVCLKTPEFCKVAFTTPEVMEELFKVV
jgi:hypothetical protein